MASYLINKGHKDESVVRIRELDGYTFRPRLNRDNLVKVNKVTVIDRVMIDKILSMKFNKAFNKLAAMAMQVINDDDSDEGDAEIVLDEAELVKQVLLNRYQKFLSYEKEQLFLKKIRLIEHEMRLKQEKIKRKAIYLEEQKKEIGRSR